LGERPRTVEPDARRVRAQVAPAGETVPAPAADHVPFPADELPWMEVADVRSDGDDLADELVADHERRPHRLLRPFVPVEDVQVGAADAGPIDADQHVVDADLG